MGKSPPTSKTNSNTISRGCFIEQGYHESAIDDRKTLGVSETRTEGLSRDRTSFPPTNERAQRKNGTGAISRDPD